MPMLSQRCLKVVLSRFKVYLKVVLDLSQNCVQVVKSEGALKIFQVVLKWCQVVQRGCNVDTRCLE